jgi:hypothetical protein
MATIWDYLVGSGGDQNLGQTQTAESPMPEYITDASARAIEAAKGIASEGYTAYGGPRVAGLSDAQKRAIAQQQGYAGQGVAGADVGIGTLGQAQGQYDSAGNYIGAGMGTAAGALGTLGSSFDAARRSGAMAGGAYGLAGQGARGVTGAEIQGFMNPYATNVIDAAARKFTEEGARQQTNLGAKAAMSGGFGGSRAAILSGMQSRSQQEGIGDLYSKGLSSAYESALSAAQEGRTRQIQGAQTQAQAAGQNTAAGNLALGATGEMRQLGALQGQLGGQQRQLGDSQRGLGMDQITAAQRRQAIGQADVTGQLGVAGLQQGIDQDSMDVAYADFLREQAYPKEQLNFLSGIISQQPYSGYSTRPEVYDSPSNFDKFVSGATGIANIYNMFK